MSSGIHKNIKKDRCTKNEFHRIFCKIAANTGHCLSEASCARSIGESAFCKKAVNEIRFSDPNTLFFLYLYINNLQYTI